MTSRIPDLRKLSHAVVLTDTGSYVQACERLHLTQSALTRSIQALEKELGIPLFDRSTRGVRPTRDGAAIVERARNLLVQARTLNKEIEQLKAVEIGSVSIGLGPAMPFLFLPDLLLALHHRHPGLSVKVVIESPGVLLNMLRDDHIECLIAETGHLGIGGSQLFTLRPLADLEAGFFVRRDHPLTHKGTVTPADLSLYPLATTQYQESDAMQLDLPYGSTRIECNDLPSIRHLIINGDAVMLGLEALFTEELVTGAICRLHVAEISTMRSCRIGLVSLAGRTPSRGALAAIHCLDRHFAIELNGGHTV